MQRLLLVFTWATNDRHSHNDKSQIEVKLLELNQTNDTGQCVERTYDQLKNGTALVHNHADTVVPCAFHSMRTNTRRIHHKVVTPVDSIKSL